MPHKRKMPKSLKKVNRIADAIAREYRKSVPDKDKISRLSSKGAKILRKIKMRK